VGSVRAMWELSGAKVILSSLSEKRMSLMIQSQISGDRKERRIFAVTQHYTRPFNPARRLGSRSRHRRQIRHIRIADQQLNHSPS
jgi:hypothetical protein